MQSIAKKTRARKASTVGAVGFDRPTAPGSKAKTLPHGSNGRSYLTVNCTPQCRWQVVRVDLTGSLDLRDCVVLVDDLDSAIEASHELAAWSEGLGLPVRDWGWHGPESETFDPAGDPGWR